MVDIVEGVGSCDELVSCLAVGDADGVWVSDCVHVSVPLGEALSSEIDDDGDQLIDAADVIAGEGVSEPLCDRVLVSDAVSLPLGVCVAEAPLVRLGVTVELLVELELGVSVVETVCNCDGVAEALGVRDPVGVAVDEGVDISLEL